MTTHIDGEKMSTYIIIMTIDFFTMDSALITTDRNS